MDLQKYIEKRPFLYHLTCEENAVNIIEKGKLLSTNALIELSGNKEDNKVKRERRLKHYPLLIEGTQLYLRDQRPISEKALGKCLTDGWNVGDFLYHLNDRVFMWPSLERLWKHFNRYEAEKPVIFRFLAKDIIEANPHVKFSRLNSGATRANSHLGGKAPARGANTFLSASDFILPIGQVAEVTFENECKISGKYSYNGRPDSFIDSQSVIKSIIVQ